MKFPKTENEWRDVIGWTLVIALILAAVAVIIWVIWANAGLVFTVIVVLLVFLFFWLGKVFSFTREGAGVTWEEEYEEHE